MMNILFPYQSKALYVVSLRRPTVAFLFKALYVVSLRRPIVAFLFKALYVVSLRRPTVAFLFKALYVVSLRRPTVALLFCIFRSRSLSDTRLAPVLLFPHFPLEESFRHSF